MWFRLVVGIRKDVTYITMIYRIFNNICDRDIDKDTRTNS